MSLFEFTNGGADEALLKSLNHNEYEDLEKGLKNKAGLVQRQVTVNGKNGTHTRMQWVKASEDQPAQKQPKAQDEQPKDKTAKAKPQAEDKAKKPDDENKTKATGSEKKTAKPAADGSGDGGDGTHDKTVTTAKWTKPTDKKGLLDLLNSGMSRADIMSAAEADGITWNHSDHEGINWMRCSMAITGATTRGAVKTEEKPAAEEPKAEEQPDTSKEVLKVRDALDGSGKATTSSKEVADMYKQNKNPNKKFEVKDNGDGTYDISVAPAEPKETKNPDKIGKDFGTLVDTEDIDDNNIKLRARAHNMMVGRLKANGGNPKKLEDIKKAAEELTKEREHVVIMSENSGEIDREFEMSKTFSSFADHFPRTSLNQLYRDVVSAKSGYRPEERASALSKLMSGASKKYDFTAYDDEVGAFGSDGGGNPVSVSLTPKNSGRILVHCTYGDGTKSNDEVFDSVDSARKYAESWLDNQADTDPDEDLINSDPTVDDLDMADPYSEIKPENGMKPFVKTPKGWVSPDWKQVLDSQQMMNLMDNIGGVLDGSGNGNPNVKPKSSINPNDPLLSNPFAP